MCTMPAKDERSVTFGVFLPVQIVCFDFRFTIRCNSAGRAGELYTSNDARCVWRVCYFKLKTSTRACCVTRICTEGGNHYTLFISADERGLISGSLRAPLPRTARTSNYCFLFVKPRVIKTKICAYPILPD